MTSRDDPLRRAIELFVYAPVGAVTEAHRLVPELVAARRDRIAHHVRLARVIGEFAVRAARGILEQRLVAPGGPVEPGDGSPATAREPPPPPARAEADDGLDPDTLAIADYTSLAASQVVACLAGLPRADLDRIERYEAAHRARRTILGQIARLEQSR